MKGLAKKKVILFIVSVLLFMSNSACGSSHGTESTQSETSTSKNSKAGTSSFETTTAANTEVETSGSESLPNKAKLTLIGHASIKIITAEGIVVYIDPYYQGDYSEKADIILVSHEHSDHNKISLCQQNEGCKVLRVKDTINSDNSYNLFEFYGVKIEPFPAANKNHPISSTNGFILTFDGIIVYHAADTSKLPQMAELKSRNIDYAFFPIDGVYNMGPAEATECAAMVGAKHNTPFHILQADAKAFKPENLLPIGYGATIELVPQTKQ
jgi:L-ascorbate metabolism protein UlaG (beta-lactamase superfamily)